MVGLPSLVFGSKIKGTRVLQVGRKNDGLIPSLTRQLNPEVPGIECHEGEFKIFRDEVLLGESIKPGDRVSKGSRTADVFPSQSRQTR